MNRPFERLMAAVTFLLPGVVLSVQLSAAVVVFTNDTVMLGSKVEETNGKLVLTVPEGEIGFPKDQIAWFSKAETSTFMQAAEEAEAAGQSKVAVRLAKEAIEKEPASVDAARALIARGGKQAAAPTPAPAAAEGGFLASAPEEAASTAPGTEPAETQPPADTAASVDGAVETAASGETSAPPAVSEPASPVEPQVASQAENIPDGWALDKSAISLEDRRVNFMVFAIVGLIVMFTIWRIVI